VEEAAAEVACRDATADDLARLQEIVDAILENSRVDRM